MSRTETHTMMRSRSSITNREQENQERTPIIDDQIRDYRLGQRIRNEFLRRVPGRNQSGYRRTLESQLNPDAELNISQFQRAQTVPAETLYQAGWSGTRHRVYQHYSDERILVVGDNTQREIPFITQQSFDELQRSGFQHLHIGLIMVRLYTLHRRSAGVNALVVIRDTRWADDRSIIGTMEMDLTSGTQLAYIAPDIMMGIRDFYNHVELVIQTHGYNAWQAGESNLLLSRSLIGRLSNTSFTNFRYNVQNVSDYLTSRGVQAIPGQRHSTFELRGRQWIINPPNVAEVQHPQAAVMRTRSDRSILLNFRNYTATPTPQTPIIEPDDEELPEEEMAMVLWTEEEETEDDIFWGAIEITAEPVVMENGPIWDTCEEEEEDFVNPFAEGGGEC